MHPIQQILLQYYEDFPLIKEEHSDQSNLSFHRNHGLSISCPSGWPVLDALAVLIADAVDGSQKNVLIIYESSETYDFLHKLCPQGNMIAYQAMPEIYSAMQSANEDPSFLKEIKSQIYSSHIVLFIGAKNPKVSALTKKMVVDWIKNFCSSCLILLDEISNPKELILDKKRINNE